MTINEQVEQAMAQWEKETDNGAMDTAFQGDVGEAIDTLVDSLHPDEVESLLTVEKPMVFVEEPAER